MIKKIKPWMLPLAMLIGVIFHDYIGHIAFLSKYLIFVMLLITYCRISFAGLKIDRSMGWLLSVQIIGALAVYALLRIFNTDIAEGIFICIFCPTATAAPVITGMLGGKIEKVATFSLLSNIAVAIVSPILLAYMGSADNAISFGESLLQISINVIPLIIGPLVAAILIKTTIPKVHKTISTHQGLSFYIWALALIIVVGNSVSFIINEPQSRIPEMIAIAVLSLGACLSQFYIGRKIGHRYGDPIASGQSLGQKNTVLAIWLALTYLNPIASVGPACYIAWHNIVNSCQIYKRAHAGML